MFNSGVRSGKAYAGEQKIREFKKLLFKSKKARKAISVSFRFDPKRLIRKATANMNNIQSQKYDYPPEVIEKNSEKSEKFRDIYDFYRVFNVQKHAKRYTCSDPKKGKSLHRRLLSKSATENVSFLNCEQIFVGRKVVKTCKGN